MIYIATEESRIYELKSHEINTVSGSGCCQIIEANYFKWYGDKCDPGIRGNRYTMPESEYDQCLNICREMNKSIWRVSNNPPPCCRTEFYTANCEFLQ